VSELAARPHWPRSRGKRGGGRAAAGWHSGHRQRRLRRHGGGEQAAGWHADYRQRRGQRRRHGAGVAVGRRHPGRVSARPTWIGIGCRRSRKPHHHRSRGRHCSPRASAPAANALAAVLFLEQSPPTEPSDNGLLSGTSARRDLGRAGSLIRGTCATRARYPVHHQRYGRGGMAGHQAGAAVARRSDRHLTIWRASHKRPGIATRVLPPP
jgi:hypothetical protein